MENYGVTDYPETVDSQTVLVYFFSVTVTKHPDKSSLREKVFTLVHHYRLWSVVLGK